jgi:hypothetical protein
LSAVVGVIKTFFPDEKARAFVLVKPVHLIIIFACEAKGGAHLGAALEQALALPANIKLGVNVIKLFTAVSYEFLWYARAFSSLV